MSHHYVDDDPCWCQTHNDGMHDTLDCPVWQKESAEADLKEKGHGESCFYCNKKCNVVAGSPSDWPMRLPVDPKKPGVVQVVCTGCILERVFECDNLKKEIKKYSCEHGLDKCFDCLEKHHIEETTQLLRYLDAVYTCYWDCCDGTRFNPCGCKCHKVNEFMYNRKQKQQSGL